MQQMPTSNLVFPEADAVIKECVGLHVTEKNPLSSHPYRILGSAYSGPYHNAITGKPPDSAATSVIPKLATWTASHIFTSV